VSQQNVEIVRGALEAFGRGDVQGALAYAHPELVTTRRDPDGAVFHGREGFLRLFSDWVEGFTEYSFRPDAYHDAGDAVVVQMRQRGRGATSGALVEDDWWMVYSVAGGKITRFEIYGDRSQAFEAAGRPTGART
jgi:ketosteroid isomerase-like protein